MTRSLVLLLALTATAVHAQSPDSALTLRAAVERAVTRGPAAGAAAGVRAIAVGRARTDAQWGNPTVELRRENEGAPIPYDDFVTVTLPVDLTGRRFALRSALGATRERAVADSIAVIREAEFATARVWWGAWVATRAAQVAQAQAERFAELARFDSLRAAEGAVAEAAALRTRLEAERAAYHAAQATAEAARARGALAARIGLADATALELADAQEEESPVLVASDDAIVSGALASRPDVRAAVANARSAESRRSAARRGVLPDVGLSGGYKGTGGFSTATFGVILTPPLLNANGGAREAGAGEWLLADADRRATELRAANEVRAALAALRAMDAGTSGIDAQFLLRAEVVAAAAEAAYREGAASLTETLDALRASADARVTALHAIADRALTRLDLRRAMGASLLETP